MRMFSRVAGTVVLSALLAAGCKDKPKAQPPSNPSGSGSGSAAKAPDEPIPNPGSGAPSRKVVVLPKSEKKPPAKTTKKLDKATLEALSKPEFDSFIHEPPTLGDKMLETRYVTKERPKVLVAINVGPCFDCIPMDVARWQAKTDSLKTFIIPELRDRKDTVFEVGGTELHGAKLVYTYLLGWAFGKDPDTEQPMGAFAHEYIAHYNDGVNQIRVSARYADDPATTKDEMIDLVPRADLETFAKRFLEYFTQEWAK